MEGESAPLVSSGFNLTSAEELAALEKRQGACGAWTPTTIREGDGNPYRNYWHQQLSENMNCGAAPGCSVGRQDSKSFTIGWAASATAMQWISGGFSVTMSWNTGHSYTCQGNRGDTVCVWYNAAHAAYTVRNAIQNTVYGGVRSVGGPYVMFSPNRNNVGGGYYCVIGAQYCRSEGQAYWNKKGRAGGP
ncbi:hypothetical protein DL766_003550 [Monosporascus sp. MC13-8B]|uniref:SCP domain-containing protein n=1 Tax=Monosporascus cannonballus TaxID=155416 RepID=A0ABY0H7V3_9PEZI|nr:hypothetical protein DL762_004398 [Monosporascus cannonballus]RYP33245.1 hypothetical protein DL766_003550 [Monosporascus sp. MC13-8B]